jgi:hypothetical protein
MLMLLNKSMVLLSMTSGDLDSAVRLSLEKLGALGKAAALVRKARSTPSAAQVARAALATGKPARPA